MPWSSWSDRLSDSAEDAGALGVSTVWVDVPLEADCKSQVKKHNAHISDDRFYKSQTLQYIQSRLVESLIIRIKHKGTNIHTIYGEIAVS